MIACHGVLSGPAIDRINACDQVTTLIVSDTITQDNHIRDCPKLKTFSTASLFAEVIYRLENEGHSISNLFDYDQLPCNLEKRLVPDDSEVILYDNGKKVLKSSKKF